MNLHHAFKTAFLLGLLQYVNGDTTEKNIRNDNDARKVEELTQDEFLQKYLHNVVDFPIPSIGGPTLIMQEHQDSQKNNGGDDGSSSAASLRGGLHHQHHGRRNTGVCEDAEDVDLNDYPQWVAEKGYWIGNLTYYQKDGTPNESEDWPYPYDSYKGFITGNIEGNAYRQRNVFLYPPSNANSNNCYVVGKGECGVNGNSLVFSADQSATNCSEPGNIEGGVDGVPAFTKTELVGADNAVLYQVFFYGQLFQSQLTTITVDSDGTMRRTRTAQSFRNGVPENASFYREKKVSKKVFYQELQNTLEEYNILESDTCFMNGFGRFPVSGYVPGFDQCKKHLEQSFDI